MTLLYLRNPFLGLALGCVAFLIGFIISGLSFRQVIDLLIEAVAIFFFTFSEKKVARQRPHISHPSVFLIFFGLIFFIISLLRIILL